MSNKRILVIINPVSGVGSKSHIPGLIAEAFSKGPYEVIITFSKEPGHASKLAQEAVENEYYAVIAVGGDGTINEIAQVLRYSPVILGIIPKGSGNGLARALNLPLTVSKAIEVISQGHLRSIDCCEANEKPFFCTCGLGYDAEVSEMFARQTRRGPINYAVAMIERYIKYAPKKFRIEIDGKSFTEKAFLVTCANAPQYGNNAYIAPHAELEDGKMDLVVLRPFTPLEAPQLALQLFTKRITSNSNLDTYKVEHVLIEQEDETAIHLDGDPVMLGKTIDIKVYGRSLKVFAPQKDFS